MKKELLNFLLGRHLLKRLFQHRYASIDAQGRNGILCEAGSRDVDWSMDFFFFYIVVYIPIYICIAGYRISGHAYLWHIAVICLFMFDV